MSLLLKNVSVHGIVVEHVMAPANVSWPRLHQLVRRGIEDGTVQPLPTHVFPRHQLERAFRFVADGTHIGKVVIQVRVTSLIC
jgi:fatty acid synthase